MLHLEPTNDIKALARKAFPGYTGRKYKLDNSGRPVNVTSYWDGGSRSYYAAVNLSTGATLPAPQNGTPFDGGPIAPDGVKVPAGFVIVEHSIFAGTDCGITFYIDPNTATAFLPDPVEISDAERTVLCQTSSLKNTYGGETDLRFKRSGLSRNDWDAASASLKARKLLNKAGAITTAGRNAASIDY